MDNDKVGLDLKTWSILVGMAATLLTIAGILMSSYFQPQTTAMVQHGELRQHCVDAIAQHSESPHRPTSNQLHALDKKIDAIGITVGAFPKSD